MAAEWRSAEDDLHVVDYDKGRDAVGQLLLLVLFIGGLSGAIMGFLLAGRIVLWAGVFGAVVAGLALGWCARGCAE